MFSTIGRAKVSDVTSADVLDVLRPIWMDKAETASRICQRISKGMKWAIAKGWRTDNPAIGIANDRLMKQTGIPDAVREKVIRTTVPDSSAPCPRDKVNRVFRAPAPSLRWVSDVTDVSMWQGFVDVAPRHGHLDRGRFHGAIIDTLADRILGWPVLRSGRDRPGSRCPSRRLCRIASLLGRAE